MGKHLLWPLSILLLIPGTGWVTPVEPACPMPGLPMATRSGLDIALASLPAVSKADPFTIEFDDHRPTVTVGPVRMTAIGSFGSIERDSGRVMYRASDGRSAIVYRPTADGVKEDLVLLDDAAFGDGIFGWGLEVDGAELRLESDGSIGLHGERHLVGRLPAPVAHDADGRPLAAHFNLHPPFVSVTVAKSPAMRFPVTVDPTITLTTDADFRISGNDEGLAKLATNQVHRDSVTGWKLSNWVATSTFTTGRHFHGSATYNNRLFVFGGIGSVLPALNDVQSAPINGDGTLGAYTTTTPFPSPARGWFGSAVYNGYLYVIGGSDFAGSYDSVVHYARLNDDGTITSWGTTTALPVGRRRMGAVAVNGFMYVVCGESSGGPVSQTLVAPIKADGTLGAWTTTAGPGFRMDHCVTSHDGTIYLLGGTNSSFNFTTVFYARTNASGTLSWNQTTDMLVARNGGTAVVSGGYMFHIGGTPPQLATVDAAPVLPGGGVGPWTNSTALPIVVQGAVAASHNGRIYLTGGSSGATESNVTYSSLPEAGHVGPWSATTPLPTARHDGGAFAHNGFAYFLGGTDTVSGTANNTVQFAPISANGTVGSWTTTTPFPTVRHGLGVTAYNGFAYVAGGYGISSPTNSVAYAPINADGTVGSWTLTTALPGNRTHLGFLIHNGRAYCIGGHDGSVPVAGVFYATVNANGTLGSWTPTTSLPTARYGHGCFQSGGYIYAVSGDVGGSWTSEVRFAQINADGSLGAWNTTTSVPNSARCRALAIGGYAYMLRYSTLPAGTPFNFFAPINADGTLGAWTSTSVWPADRDEFAAIAHDGFLYQLGGVNSTGPQVSVNEVRSARVTTHGTVGSWTTQAGLMPGPRSQCGMAAYNGFLYVGGGELGGSDNSDVLFAPVNADGSAGLFTATTPFSGARRGPGMVAHNGFLYVVSGYNGATGDVFNVQFAPINANGTVGTWTATTPLTNARNNFGCTVYNGRLYVVAGGGGAGATEVVFAPINANGTLGSWTATSALPAARTTLRAAAYNGFLYAVGGNEGANLATATFVAPINADGTLGAWTTTTSPTSPRSYFSAAVHNGWIYIFGGSNAAGGGSISSASAAPILSNGSLGGWQDLISLPVPRQNLSAVVSGGIVYVQAGYNSPLNSHFNEIFWAPLRTPASRATYSRLVDFGSDQNIAFVNTLGGGSNGTATLSIRTATSAGSTFGSTTTSPVTFGTPTPAVATARYVHVLYTLDDTMSVATNPDATAHLAIDDIILSTTAPPNAPTALGQFQTDGTTPILVAKGSDTGTVVFKATLSDPDALDTIRLHVEVKPVGTAFTNVATQISPFVANGAVATVTIPGLTPGTQYHWQCVAEDINGSFSTGGVAFGGNTDPNDPDFFIDQAPSGPAPNQFQSDGVTPIPDGGTTLSSTVVLEGTRSDADALSLVKVQLEFRAAGDPLTGPASPSIDGIIFFESTFDAPLVNASFTLPGLAAGGYHWQMRCVDDNAKTSSWFPFSASGTHFTVPSSNVPPNAPAALLQFENDGTTPIAFDAFATAAAVKLQGTLSDLNGADTVKLQIELRATGIAFSSPGSPVIDGIVFFETTLQAQGPIQAAVTIPTDGSFHWQARTVDNNGAASVWTVAGGNTDPDDPDIKLNLVNDPPTINPATVGQFQSDGSTVIAIGGNATTLGVIFKATVVDPEAATVTLEIELRDTLTGFTPFPTHSAGPFASGSVISVAATPAIGAYHWAYRAGDGVTFSAWTSFGANPEANADFNVAVNAGPAVASLAQFKADGITSLPIGSSTTGTVVLQGVVTDPEGQTVSLAVEVKPVGVAFDGTISMTSSLVASGSTIQVTVAGLADGAYHWQARGVDVLSAPGAFASFGGNPEADPDFRVDTANGAPSDPFSIGQYVPGGAGLALGGAPFGRTVLIRAMASDEELGQLAFEVEVQPLGTAFTNTRTHPTTLSFGPPGVFAEITLTDLSGGGYHWQIRTVDAFSQASNWLPYGSNAESAADFEITATTAVPPNAPINLQQRLANDLVPVTAGDTIAQASIRLKALVVHPRTEIVKLQVEVKPLATAFTGVADRESAFVDSGAIAEVLIFGFPNDGYHWQARTADSKGTVSAWLSFGEVEIDADFIVAVPVNNPPDVPPYVLQHGANGVTLIPVGGVTTQSTFTLHAFAADPDDDAVRLEIEVKPVGIAFDGTLSGSTGFSPSGTDLFLQIGSLADGRYHWRARMTDAVGASSAWAAYGGNTEDDADLIVNSTSNSAPAAPTALEQLRESGTIAVEVGGFAGAGDLTFRSDASDPDSGDLVRLEINARPEGETFTPVPTHSGDFVPANFVVDAIIGRFNIGTGYRWQARIVDVNGLASGWVDFGSNGTSADFVSSFTIAGGNGKTKCGSVGFDVLLPLGLLVLWRRRARRAVASQR